MNKNFDDIVPPGRRSIRKVEVEKRARRGRSVHREEPEAEYTPDLPRTRRSGSRWGLWVIAVVSLLILVFGFSFLFSGAKVTVVPKQRTVLADGTFEAFKNPGALELGYEIMTIEREGEERVTASGEEFVEEKASGTIVIYNNHSSANQQLVKNTRFETPEGLIYRIQDPVVVPGQRKEGGVTTPGSIEVVVYADQPGESYDIGLTDFTIPGFKGDPRYETFYARSKTDMTGGFSGQRKVVSQADETAARETIRRRLSESLKAEALSQKPEGFELFGDGMFVAFSELPDATADNQVVVRERGTLYGVLFKEGAFAQFIARNTVAGFEEEPVSLTGSDGLAFTMLDKSTARPWEEDALSFSLSGNTHVVWTFDAEQLKKDLAGKSKGALQTVLTGYPSITEAQVVLRPFWRQTFPEETRDIKITTRIEE